MVEAQKNEYVYLEIPFDYVCVYHKLLTYLADFGEDALRDCDTTCRGANKTIIQCWNMFQAALAAKAIGKDKQADVLIKYIEAQLELIYKGTDKEMYTSGPIYPIDEKGHVYARVTCYNGFEFFVPIEDGEDGSTCGDEPTKAFHLYLKYFGKNAEQREFDLITDSQKNLVVSSNYVL